MKQLICIALTIFSFSANAEKVQDNYWEIVSAELDSNIANGFSKISIIIEDLSSDRTLENVEINSNYTTFLGVTDEKGEFEALIKSGDTRFCADSEKGGSFVTNHVFKSQFLYRIKIKMKNKKPIEIIQPHAVKKPVIYLYPQHKQAINVQVIPKGDFIFTYPVYPEKGWSVIAEPNGTLNYKNRSFNYLFWEANSYVLEKIDISNGFVVNSDTIVPFLENTLSQIGLSNIEQADFITYWAPKLQQNKLNYIHFEFNEGYDTYISKMIITPKPQSLIRVFMLFKPVNSDYKFVTQTITSYKRKGFTVVEWGGSEL